MTINERIAYYRKKSRLTQEQAAERMDMKTGTYAKMEQTGKIDSERLIKLSELFEISPMLLLFDNGLDKDEDLISLINDENGSKTKFRQQGPELLENEYIPTNRELSAMKIIHNLPRNVREEVFDYIANINKEYN